MRRLIVLIAILLVVLGISNGISRYSPRLKDFLSKHKITSSQTPQNAKVISEESVVIDVVKRVGPSVITIAETPLSSRQNTLDPNDPFSFFGNSGRSSTIPTEPQNIGSGFIVTKDGYIVTNKHVVSDNTGKYTVVTHSNKKYTVQKIYRDPLNDIAILKIDPTQNGENLQPVEMGDSSRLQVGQLAIAIGTALGEFNNTVTTGVISGTGRGITAGSAFEGFVEQLDNVIQTDAAINPGNSGGPLLNSAGQVIGVNTAVSQSGQNIGFALPIDVVKDSLKNFNETGQFIRPYLGVAYAMVNREQALQNGIPEGAYIQTVVPNSAAEKAGIKQADVVTIFDGKKVQGDRTLAKLISSKKVGDRLKITIWRNGEDDNGKGKTIDFTITLDVAPGQ